MTGTKYLSEMMEGIEIKENTLIISPCGSGKTHYILNDLCKDKKVLYLCDNNNLKTQVINDTVDYENIDVMTYHAFGNKVKFDTKDELIQQYDLVIGDEIHNLVDYQSFDNSGDLMASMIKLFAKYDNAIVILFTATPYYLQKLATDFPNVDINFGEYYDFSDNKEIKRYIEKRKAYINHVSQIQFTLDEYADGFKYDGLKCLIYTKKIEEMEFIKDMCLSRNLNPICIWSTSNNEKPMNQEQLRVRKQLLLEGTLADGYNVLIINRSTETGVNIYDKKMELCIVNTTNKTQIVQARGRIRHNVDLLVVRTNDEKKVGFVLEIDKKLLGVPMLKQDIEEKIIHTYGLKDNRGRFYTISKLGNILEEKGYTIEKKRKTIEGKKFTLYTIEKK